MSASIFRISKVCLHCNKPFEAQKIITRFCSHACASRDYKFRKRLEKKGIAESPERSPSPFRPIANAQSIELIKQKEFLTVKDLATLFGCSRQSVYNMIEAGTITAVNLLQKKTLIRRAEVDRLFEKPAATIEPEEVSMAIPDCYTYHDIEVKYKKTYQSVGGLLRRHNVPRIKHEGLTYVPKSIIDKIFAQ